MPNAEILPISALNKFNLDKILERILELLPIAPPYYEKDAIKLIQHLHKNKNTIIVVGGSGLYIQAINNKKWSNVTHDKKLAIKIEEIILNKARELRIKNSQQ